MPAYTLRSKSGLTAHLTQRGATVETLELRTPDGTSIRVAQDGVTTGRYANRIAGGRFVLDGVTHSLSVNRGTYTLHGGEHGFAQATWRSGLIHEADGTTELAFLHVSHDGDQGFPGELHVSVRYVVGPGDTVTIHYRATTTKPTVINLTNHAYFRFGDDPIDEHTVELNASRYVETDEDLIPTGEIASVEGTRFDLRRPRAIELFDNTFVIDGEPGTLRKAATLSSPRSNRQLTIRTTEPSIQLYTHDRRGIALETQHFPDSPNHPNFPSTVLRPGETFESATQWTFLIE
jgi:aldose 1-epimerase